MIKQCRICNRPIGLYAVSKQIYCDKSIRDCWNIAKSISQRIAKQNAVMKRIIDGIKCQRCGTTVHKKGMKKYCQDCRDSMEGYVNMIKKKAILNTNCLECGSEIEKKQHLKYCKDCKPIVKKRQSKIKTDEIAEKVRKLKAKNKILRCKKINPMFLAPQGSKRKGK